LIANASATELGVVVARGKVRVALRRRHVGVAHPLLQSAQVDERN
jgi:hypothetical protein